MVTIALLHSWCLWRRQGEAFGCSILLQKRHIRRGLRPAQLCMWKLGSPSWNITGARSGLECDRQPWTRQSRISQLTCIYSSYSQQWVLSVQSFTCKLWAVTGLQRPVGVNSMRMSQCQGRWQCCKVWLWCDKHRQWQVQEYLCWSAGLILTVLTGQDSH